MTSFADGPAKGQVLELNRIPKLLRVVECGGKWDALDQLDDEPDLLETLYAYRICDEPIGTIHIDYRDGKGRRRGKWLPIAKYRYIEEQPDQDTMRDKEKWREWTTNYAKSHHL